MPTGPDVPEQQSLEEEFPIGMQFYFSREKPEEHRSYGGAQFDEFNCTILGINDNGNVRVSMYSTSKWSALQEDRPHTEELSPYFIRQVLSGEHTSTAIMRRNKEMRNRSSVLMDFTYIRTLGELNKKDS